MQSGKFDRAEQTLKNLVKEAPQNADAWQLLATCYKNQGATKKALQAFETSLRLQPAQPHTWNNLANLHLQCENYEQAIKAYRKALQIDNNYDNARLNLALALTRAKKFPESLEHLSKLQIKHPDNPQILIGIGDNLRELKKNKEALDAYKKALNVSRDQFLPLFKIGLTHKKAKQLEKARLFFEKSLKLHPNSITVLHNLASTEAADGNLKKAIQLYKKCIQLEPANPDHHRWLNKLLWMCESHEFLNSYEAISESLRYQPDIIIEKSKFHRLAGEINKAEEELERAISYGHNTPELLAELSAVYRASGRLSKSISLLEKPAQHERNQSILRDELGHAYLQSGDFKKCKQIYSDLVNLFPLNQGFWCMYATTTQQLGDPIADELLDYNQLVRTVEIPPPSGFSSIHKFNLVLAKHLEKLHNTKREPIDQSISGGTQTLNDLFDIDDPIIQKLKQSLKTAILDHTSRLEPRKGHPFLGRLPKNIEFSGSWSVNLKRHGYHLSHFHTDGWISSAYYIEVPQDIEKNGEGWIEFGKPAFPVPNKEHADYAIKPKEGMLVLFPSYMWHGTRPFTSSNRRLTIAFDAIPTM